MKKIKLTNCYCACSFTLDSDTKMQYIGDNENFDPIITVKAWQSLPPENRNEYILDDFVAAVRECEDLEIEKLDMQTWEYEVEDV